MRVGIGVSAIRDSRSAGATAAGIALDELAGGLPGLLLVFATAGYDQEEILRGVREVSTKGEIVGCSTSGVISSEGCAEQRYAVGVLAIASNGIRMSAYSEPCFSQDPSSCGRKLAEKVRGDLQESGGLLILLPDGLTGNVSQFLAAVGRDLPERVAIVGGTAGELLKNEKTWQYLGRKASANSVSAILLQGDFHSEIAVSHGCDIVGKEQEITREKNGWVYEIDGQPAWSVYREYLNVGDAEPLSMAHYCYICLAKQLQRPERNFGPHVIRCPLGVDRKNGALFFPGGLEVGSRVRMALRSSEQTLKRNIEAAKLITGRQPGRKPMLVLQFDCCCRGKLMFGDRNPGSVRPLQEVFGLDIPWFGLQTYGEIAKLEGRSAIFHNYTNVLCALYSGKPDHEEVA